MITLHTFDNDYAEGEIYHQFLQRDQQPLLESEALGAYENLGAFLDGLAASADIENELFDPGFNDNPRQWEDERLVLKAAGDIPGYLRLLDDYVMTRDSNWDLCSSCQTEYGTWTYNPRVLTAPTLREQQNDVWAEDPVFPKFEWRHVVACGATTVGYWEWVTEQRPAALDKVQLRVSDGCLVVPWRAIYTKDMQEHFNGEDAMLLCRYPAGDCDSASWPNPNIAALRGALFDARETGLIRDGASVLLPNGEEFFIDQPYWKVDDHVTWTDPDDGVCSRTGILTAVSELGDSKLTITMDDGWMAEVCESELQRA